MLGKRGQSTLEYVIILTAIIAVVVAFAAGWFRARVKQSLRHVSDEMREQVNKINY